MNQFLVMTASFLLILGRKWHIIELFVRFTPRGTPTSVIKSRRDLISRPFGQILLDGNESKIWVRTVSRPQGRRFSF